MTESGKIQAEVQVKVIVFKHGSWNASCGAFECKTHNGTGSAERTGQINPESTAKMGNIPHNAGGGIVSGCGTPASATCITVERVRWGSGGGGEGGVLGQEAEGRGRGDQAVGAVVLSGEAGDNGVFHGDGTFGSGRGRG